MKTTIGVAFLALGLLFGGCTDDRVGEPRALPVAVENYGAEPFVELEEGPGKINEISVLPEYPELTVRGPEFDWLPDTYSPVYVFFQQELVSGDADPIEILAGEPFTFSWSGAGDLIKGYSWGLDIPKPEAGGPGWSPWSKDTRTQTPIILRVEGMHTFHVRVQNAGGLITLGMIRIKVVRPRFEHDVLFVDDFKDSIYPTDTQHDAFWQELFQGYPNPLDWQNFEAALPQDPAVPTLEELSRYKLLVWENRLGFGGKSGLLEAGTLHPILSLYLHAGGKLWVGGILTVSAMVPSVNGTGANLNYPKTDIGPGDFAYDFMKLQSSRIDRASRRQLRDSFNGVTPFPGASPIYNSMSLDLRKLRTPFYVSLTDVDAVIDPIIDESDPGFRGEIERLYAYRAYGNEVLGQPSSFHDKLTGLRWHDPNPDPEHGRIQWFGFPLYYMRDTEAQDTFNKSLNWFREGP